MKGTLALTIAVVIAVVSMSVVPAYASGALVVTPSSIPSGGTVTLKIYYGASATGESESVTAIKVCSPGTSGAPCPTGSTAYSYTGTLPTFTCASGKLCTGTFVVTYPSSTPGVCSITSAAGTGTCTPTGSPTCSTSTCWTSGANTRSGNFGVLVLYTNSVTEGTQSADGGFSATAIPTPEFGASVLIVVGLSLAALMMLRRRMVVPSLT